jgi:glycosyltransferase involved in cell wall biosynthesis
MFFPEFQEIGRAEVLTIVAGFAFLLIVINYILNYLPVSLLKTPRLGGAAATVPVSVIICARNEDENLAEFLPRVMEQDYPDFEVIVVNDCSSDNTENVIDGFAKVFPNLRKANIKEDAYYKHGKKFAMLVGIKAARHNHMVFTDADCYPVTNQWLKEMAGGFSEGREIVLGYGAYEKLPGFLNKLIRFDAFIIGLQFMSAAVHKKPYMGVGRNLAYTKELFFRHKGFSTHYHIASGDDDLFVSQAGTDSNTNVCIHSEAITVSKARRSFRDWRMQKARHLTTSPLYAAHAKARIAFNYFSQYFFLAALIALAFSMKSVLLIPILLFLKVIVQLLVLNKACKRMRERDLLAGSALYELILLFIYPIFHVTKIFHKANRWTN